MSAPKDQTLSSSRRDDHHALEKDHVDESDEGREYASSVTAGSVLCCLLFLVLILLGIALIAAGATVYVENDGYKETRLKALREMCDKWTKECEAKMNTVVSGGLKLMIKAGTKTYDDESTNKETVSEKVSEVDPNLSMEVTFVRAKLDVKTKDVDTLDVSVYAKGAKDKILAEALGVPLRHEIDVPAVCNVKLTHKHCKADDMCGDLTFEGDLKECTDKKECGRCKGSGYLHRVCVIGDFCTGSTEKVELVGCEYPFLSDSQYYTVKKHTNIEFLVFDVNTPSIMKQLILSGSDIDAPSVEQASSRKKGKILFGVGIPVLVLALFSLVVLCVCRRWWCFDNGEIDDEIPALQVEDSWNESAIPMHGLGIDMNHVNSSN